MIAGERKDAQVKVMALNSFMFTVVEFPSKRRTSDPIEFEIDTEEILFTP